MNKIFKIEHQFDLYLSRMGMAKENLIPVQLIETKRAFIGAWSQLLFLFRDDIIELSENDAIATMESMVNQCDKFWEDEVKQQFGG